MSDGELGIAVKIRDGLTPGTQREPHHGTLVIRDQRVALDLPTKSTGLSAADDVARIEAEPKETGIHLNPWRVRWTNRSI